MMTYFHRRSKLFVGRVELLTENCDPRSKVLANNLDLQISITPVNNVSQRVIKCEE